MKKNSSQWCKQFGIKLGEDIVDPVGWDTQWNEFNVRWQEEITLDEFKQRLMFSTVRASHHHKDGLLIGTLVI